MSESARGVVRSVALATALLVIGLPRIAGAAGPTPSPTPLPRPFAIDKNSVLILIRTTLIALQQANQTGNYGVFYGISAPGFQSANSPERLSQIFANLRAKNFDLSAVVVLEPQLTVLPEIYSNGVMRMAGFFPSAPMQVNFEMQFIPVQGQWRLLAISVDVGSAAPVAPSTATPPAPRAQPVETKPAPSAGGKEKTTESSPAPAATPNATWSPSVGVDVKPKPSATASPRK